MCLPRLVPVVLFLILSPNEASAQDPALADYHHLLPPMPHIVGETEASRAFHLFGDTSAATYRDVAPRDGIDDRRASRLLALAETFSPLLRRNNFSVPIDFARVGDSSGIHLHQDVWLNGRLARRDSTLLLPVSAPRTGPVATSDPLLATVISRDLPALHTATVDPDERSSFVLYVDMPGHDERSWRSAYQDMDARESRVFAHPFLERARDGRSVRFVMQYWFFYPFNDGPNNHEGDWEHINVVLGWPEPGRDQPDLLSSNELARILDQDQPLPDSLAIGFVEYYFHESVVVLDYQARARTDDEAHPFEDGDWLSEVVALRREYAGGRLATHPVGYIGANPTGPDELFDVLPRFTFSYNRNPHGTYPAPGLWQHVGAMGSTERVQGSVVPAVHENSARPWYELIADSAWLVFPADRIVLVPDWERVAGLALVDADVARRWAWLFLPIRFGFPIARSPGAGLVPHADLGNVAPEGPAFQPTWNRLSDADAPQVYTPTVVRIALVSTTPWTGVQSGWGALNMPLFAAGLMPGYNVLLSQVMPWLTSALEIMDMPPPRTYYRGALPPRFSSISGGMTYDVGGDELAAVIPEPAAGSSLAAGARARPSTFARSSARLNRFSLTLYDGRRLSVENTFDWGDSRASYELADSTGNAGTSTADVSIRELRGGFRYALLMRASGAARLDARAGYGWMRFASRNGSIADGAASERLADESAGYLPTVLPSRRWWPNSWWVGGAAELFTPRDRWIGSTVGYGLRLESALSFHRLDDEVASGSHARRVTSSVSVVLGW